MIVDGKNKKNIDRAVQLIADGEVVAFPTETVYGLGADALNSKAVRKVFETKGRPFSDPLIVHVADKSQVEEIAQDIPKQAEVLMSQFWPGPLTLVLRKKNAVPSEVTAGRDTVALRMPRHLIALALIKNSKRPLCAPSANRFQSLSPTTAKDVEKELGLGVQLILDGGPCEVGVESTVLTLVGGPRILRLGGTSVEAIEAALRSHVPIDGRAVEPSLESPGMLDFHYAPRKPLKFLTSDSLKTFMRKRGSKKVLASSGLICFSRDDQKEFSDSGFKSIVVLSKRGNLEEAARKLFRTLRSLDEGPEEKIFALMVPNEGLGLAINDRLKKAEHGFEDR